MRRWGFAIPLLLPLLLLPGALLGGGWSFLTVAFVFGVVPLLDLMSGRDHWNPAQDEVRELEASRYYRFLLYAWAVLQFSLLAWMLQHAARLDSLTFVGMALSVGTLTGAIGITIAHELGHKLDWRERLLGRLLLASVCYAHFQVEHNKGHHAHVATPQDPATARAGQSLYAFLPQTIMGSAKSAWSFEADRLAKAGRTRWHWRNAVLQDTASSILLLSVAWLLAGTAAALFFLLQSAVAIFLLEIVNYVEHYGLTRSVRPGGGYERVQTTHSWNASERFTNWLLFNLQRHSHHHVEHHRRYQVLRHVEDSPQLPTGYAGMVLLALVPSLWRKVMDERLRAWRGGVTA